MSKNALLGDQERYSVYVGAKVVICFEMCKGWADFFIGGCAFAFSVIWVVGTLRWSGLSGTRCFSGRLFLLFEERRTRHAVSLHWDLRCFSGGIVFVDVLEVLDATLSRFFSLATERVSFTLYRRNILRLYHSRMLELSVPTLGNTHCHCVLFLNVYSLWS